MRILPFQYVVRSLEVMTPNPTFNRTPQKRAALTFTLGCHKNTCFFNCHIYKFVGCVGINISSGSSTTSREVTKQQIELPLSPNPWDGIQHPTDGKVTVKSEKEWCGITIWALLPIPLMLPVCKSEVSFTSNIPIKVESTHPNSIFYGCGIFMPILGMDGGPRGFCQKRLWR